MQGFACPERDVPPFKKAQLEAPPGDLDLRHVLWVPSREHMARSSSQCQASPGTTGSGQTGPATCLLTLGRMPFSVGSAWSPQAVARQAVGVVSP